MESRESPAQMLQHTLHISSELADKLVAGGISTLEEVAYVPFAELREIGGLWDEEATSLRNLARNHLLNKAIGDNDLGDLAKGVPDV